MSDLAGHQPLPLQRRSEAAAHVAAIDPQTGRPLLRLLALASITVSFLAAPSAPTLLYSTYQAVWNFSALTTTVVFGVYAAAGRRPRDCRRS
jgi:hypothetical protein